MTQNNNNSQYTELRIYITLIFFSFHFLSCGNLISKQMNKKQVLVKINNLKDERFKKEILEVFNKVTGKINYDSEKFLSDQTTDITDSVIFNKILNYYHNEEWKTKVKNFYNEIIKQNLCQELMYLVPFFKQLLIKLGISNHFEIVNLFRSEMKLNAENILQEMECFKNFANNSVFCEFYKQNQINQLLYRSLFKVGKKLDSKYVGCYNSLISKFKKHSIVSWNTMYLKKVDFLYHLIQKCVFQEIYKIDVSKIFENYKYPRNYDDEAMKINKVFINKKHLLYTLFLKAFKENIDKNQLIMDIKCFIDLYPKFKEKSIPLRIVKDFKLSSKNSSLYKNENNLKVQNKISYQKIIPFYKTEDLIFSIAKISYRIECPQKHDFSQFSFHQNTLSFLSELYNHYLICNGTKTIKIKLTSTVKNQLLKVRDEFLYNNILNIDFKVISILKLLDNYTLFCYTFINDSTKKGIAIKDDKIYNFGKEVNLAQLKFDFKIIQNFDEVLPKILIEFCEQNSIKISSNMNLIYSIILYKLQNSFNTEHKLVKDIYSQFDKLNINRFKLDIVSSLIFLNDPSVDLKDNFDKLKLKIMYRELFGHTLSEFCYIYYKHLGKRQIPFDVCNIIDKYFDSDLFKFYKYRFLKYCQVFRVNQNKEL